MGGPPRCDPARRETASPPFIGNIVKMGGPPRCGPARGDYLFCCLFRRRRRRFSVSAPRAGFADGCLAVCLREPGCVGGACTGGEVGC